jgi:hypothetical protein
MMAVQERMMRMCIVTPMPILAPCERSSGLLPLVSRGETGTGDDVWLLEVALVLVLVSVVMSLSDQWLNL